jgi:hypothetical protein
VLSGADTSAAFVEHPLMLIEMIKQKITSSMRFMNQMLAMRLAI